MQMPVKALTVTTTSKNVLASKSLPLIGDDIVVPYVSTTIKEQVRPIRI